MMDFMGLMKQAQQMQAKMAETQLELDHIEVEGTAGGGLVKLRLTAKGALRAVEIDPSLLAPDQKEILEDLIVSAHLQARSKADEAMAEKMKELTGGLQLPPGFKLPFG
jgi:DNA-binding YbaB/EbfC family protein